MTPDVQRSPRVSIVLPTYNRHATLGRAVASVEAQRFRDWELIVVDDGSTDGSVDALEGRDPRLRIIRQANRGVAGARNTGLKAARGELIAFLDSDDEWPKHHLALAVAFFEAHPGDDVFSSEFWEDFGDGRYLKHFQPEMGEWFPATARRIGSSAFQGAPPSGDPYLWCYEQRAPVGEWAKAALAGTGYEGAFEYRGRTFEQWRWGWLMAMQPTVITRRALEEVGPLDESYPVASDFGWLASLCRRFTVTFVSAPGCLKYELDGERRPLSEGHLVTGRTATQFHLDVLRFHEELFLRAHPDDPELIALHAVRQALVGRSALLQGQRSVALTQLSAAARHYHGADVEGPLWLARAVPSAALAATVFRLSTRGAGMAQRLRQRVAERRP